ncbi:MAG: tyrosine-type recombinase/integrase [Bacteroidales bacterium]|jgi:integrase/recombinase XerC|nr:tyrosine-type recombinase/integrase [Bacteroidales bacterium]
MEALTQFINCLKYEKRSSINTILAYQSDLTQFFNYTRDFFQIEQLEQIDASIIRTWILTLVEEKKEARSINRKLSALKAFFNYYVKIQHLAKNPMVQISSLKMAKRLPQFVEEQDMNTLFTAELFEENFEGWRDRTIIELFYATGMRLSELIHLTKNDIDLYENRVKVLGKRNKERLIPFGYTVRNTLMRYFSLYEEKYGQLNNNTLVFVTIKGRPLYPKAVYLIIRKYLDMVTRIDKRSPHIIRHTFATHLLNNGADINALKEILGHSSLAATQIYTHNSIEKLKNIYKQAHPRA